MTADARQPAEQTRFSFVARQNGRPVTAHGWTGWSHRDRTCDSCGESLPVGTMLWHVNAFIHRFLCLECGDEARS